MYKSNNCHLISVSLVLKCLQSNSSETSSDCEGRNDTCVLTFETGSEESATRKCDRAENVSGGSLGCVENNGSVTCSCIDDGCNKDRDTAIASVKETITKLDVLVETFDELKKVIEGHPLTGNKIEGQNQTNVATDVEEKEIKTVLAHEESISTNKQVKNTPKTKTNITPKKEMKKTQTKPKTPNKMAKTTLKPKAETKPKKTWRDYMAMAKSG